MSGMGFIRGSREISVPLNQFTPHRLHRMYEMRVTRGLRQNGQSGSLPTSLTRSSGVISYQVFFSIVPPPRPTLRTVGRYNLTPQPYVFTLLTYPDSCSRFHCVYCNQICAYCKRIVISENLRRKILQSCAIPSTQPIPHEIQARTPPAASRMRTSSLPITRHRAYR